MLEGISDAKPFFTRTTRLIIQDISIYDYSYMLYFNLCFQKHPYISHHISFFCYESNLPGTDDLHSPCGEWRDPHSGESPTFPHTRLFARTCAQGYRTLSCLKTLEKPLRRGKKMQSVQEKVASLFTFCFSRRLTVF